MRTIAVLLLLCLPAPSWAQAAPIADPWHWIDQTTAWISVGEVELVAPPCKQTRVVRDLPLPQPAGAGTPTIEMLLQDAIGAVEGKHQIQNQGVRVELEGTGGGVVVPASGSTGPKCVGAVEALLRVEIRATYTFPTAATSVSTMAAFRAADPDMRVAINVGRLNGAISLFQGLEYGNTIRLQELSCGDPRFSVTLKSAPSLKSQGWWQPDGQYGVRLDADLGAAEAQIHETCVGVYHPRVRATGTMSTNASDLSSAQKLTLTGAAYIYPFESVLGIRFPIQEDVALGATPLNAIPVELTPASNATLDFGRLNGTVWNSSGPKKQIPVVINGYARRIQFPFQRDLLFLDATIGTQPRYASFANATDARRHLDSDNPIPDTFDVGVTVRESLFGSAGPGGNRGLLGELLPIRISGMAEGKFLFFKVKKKYEVVLGIASVVLGEGADQGKVTVTLGATYLRIGTGKAQIATTEPLKSVSASATFNNVRYDGEGVRFDVADFHLDIQTTHLLLPITVSSGALERALNGGQLKLTKPGTSVIELPECIYTGYEKLKSPNDVCGPGQLIGWLGRSAGKRRVDLEPDASSFNISVVSHSAAGASWKGLQAYGRVIIK